MKVGSVTIAYNEERLIGKNLDHNPLENKLVLVSSVPWQGEPEPGDNTVEIVERSGADYLLWPWPTEQEQRNAGQHWYYDYDWIIVLDPDEFLTKHDWNVLLRSLENAEADAYVCERQLTYWKSGYVIDPPEDYKQLIAVRPGVRFVDKRVVNVGYGTIPVTLHHMSWARTDDEVRSKLAHYAHAHEINPNWYEEVWLPWKPGNENLHPLTPPSLKRAVPAKLPPELEELNLWPTSTNG